MRFTLEVLQAGPSDILAAIHNDDNEMVLAMEIQRNVDHEHPSILVGKVYRGRDGLTGLGVSISNVYTLPLSEALILTALKRLVTSLQTGVITSKVHLTHPARALPQGIKELPYFFVEEPVRLTPVLESALIAVDTAFGAAGHNLMTYL